MGRRVTEPSAANCNNSSAVPWNRSQRYAGDLSHWESGSTLCPEQVCGIASKDCVNIHPEFQTPVGGPVVVSSPQVGQVTSTYDPRIGQLALRFTFWSLPSHVFFPLYAVHSNRIKKGLLAAQQLAIA